MSIEIFILRFVTKITSIEIADFLNTLYICKMNKKIRRQNYVNKY